MLEMHSAIRETWLTATLSSILIGVDIAAVWNT